MMDKRKQEALAVAKRVNWYTPPEKVVANPKLFLAQVMARGGTDDIIWMQRRYSTQELQDAYRNAPAGLFRRRCWAYWGLKLLGAPDAHPYPVRFPGLPTVPWPGFN